MHVYNVIKNELKNIILGPDIRCYYLELLTLKTIILSLSHVKELAKLPFFSLCYF